MDLSNNLNESIFIILRDLINQNNQNNQQNTYLNDISNNISSIYSSINNNTIANSIFNDNLSHYNNIFFPTNQNILFFNYRNSYNNFLNNSINNFIDSTLNTSKPVYKKITSNEGYQQVQDIQYSNKDNFSQNMCPIYCIPFAEGEIVSKLPCNHIFSKDGINKWLQESNLCPVCRYELAFCEIKATNNINTEEENNLINNISNIDEDISDNLVEFDNDNLEDESTITLDDYSTSNLDNNQSNNYSPLNFVDLLLQQEELEYQQALLRSLSEN